METSLKWFYVHITQIREELFVSRYIFTCLKENLPPTSRINKPRGHVHPDIGLWTNDVWIDYFHCRDDYAHHEFQTSIFYSGTDSSVIK